MRYYVATNCNNFSMMWEKYVFHWEEFEHVTNCAHSTIPQISNMWNENTWSASLLSTMISR